MRINLGLSLLFLGGMMGENENLIPAFVLMMIGLAMILASKGDE